MATYYPQSTYADGYHQSWPGGSHGATSEVEAFIWRCRQDQDRNVRYRGHGNCEMDSETVTTFLNMLTDVHFRCRAMEDQLTDLHKHAQRVTTQLDSMVTHPAKQAPSSSATSVSSADTVKAIHKLQWKIFDLQRENEALMALLEMQRTKYQLETETAGKYQEDAEHSAQGSESTPKSPPNEPPAQTTVTLSFPQDDKSQESDSRVVILANSYDGVTSVKKQRQESCASRDNDTGRQVRIEQQQPSGAYPQDRSGYPQELRSGYLQERSGYHQQERSGYQQERSGHPKESDRYQQGGSWFHPEGSVSIKTSKDDQKSQEEYSGSNTGYSQPKEADPISGCSKELATESAQGSTPARYPHTWWTSSDRNKLRAGVPSARQPWRWTSPHPRLFQQASTRPPMKAAVPEPRYQSTPKNSSLDDSRNASPILNQTGEDAGTSSISYDPYGRSDPCTEACTYSQRYPYAAEANDLRLNEFNLYATPEDIQLVQGTLELLNSINKLEYTNNSSK